MSLDTGIDTSPISSLPKQGDQEKFGEGGSFQWDLGRPCSGDFQGGDRGESGESDSAELSDMADIPS